MAEEEERRLLIGESADCLRFVVEEERLSIGPTYRYTRLAKLVGLRQQDLTDVKKSRLRL